MIKRYKHQTKTTEFVVQNPRTMVLNDPGTGKTLAMLDAIDKLGARALVFAPKSILLPSWLADIQNFTPHLTAVVANANNRKKALASSAKICLTNHDAATAIAEWPELYKKYDFIIVDESTAYKTPTSKRSKAIAKITQSSDLRSMMTGTPMAHSVLDIWHQAYLADDGERLGPSFYRFRNMTCEPLQVGRQPNMVRWVPKPGVEEVVAEMLSDITIRFRQEDCIDLPKNQTITYTLDLPAKLRIAYDQMRDRAVLAIAEGTVTAQNAAVLAGKLMQIAAGNVYGEDRSGMSIDPYRIQFICDLIEARAHSFVLFQWKHQRDALVSALKKRKITHAVIDGDMSSSPTAVNQVVDAFQKKGKYQVLLAHPRSVEHGLTLTRATSTIWVSPPTRPESFIQANRRIYRAGQTKETETILIQAANTIEEAAYERLQSKQAAQLNMLELIANLTQ